MRANGRTQRKGTGVPCYVSMLLEDASLETKDGKVDEQRDADIKWTANSLYAASIDTVSGLPFPRLLFFSSGRIANMTRPAGVPSSSP